MRQELIDRILAHVRADAEAMVELQKRMTPLVAMAPENGGEGEWSKARLLRSYLEEMGLPRLEEHNAPDERVPEGTRPNLAAWIPGTEGDRTVWVMGHTDVVPPGNRKLWDQDPWTVVERDGLLFGRGVEDNHQGCLTGIFALKALLELGIRPRWNVGVLLVADEEVGSRYGASYLVEQPGLFQPKDLLIIPDAGNEDGTMIEVAEKGSVWARFRTEGRQCHASRPGNGINAFRAASHLVARLDGLAEEFAGEDSMFVPPTSTFEPTKKEPNVPNVNTVPGEDVFHMDCRLLPRHRPEDVVAAMGRHARAIEERFGVRVQVDADRASSPPPVTAPDSPVVVALQRAIHRVTGREALPMGIGGGTVAAIFRRAGYQAAVWATVTGTAHQPDEHCRIENMVSDAQVVALLMAAEED